MHKNSNKINAIILLKKTYFILFCSLSLIVIYNIPLSAQDIYFSNYINNLPVYNPSFTGLFDKPEISAVYRTQWQTNPAAFQTYGISYIHTIPSLNGSLGIHLLRDSEGNQVITTNSLTSYYSYYIEFSERLTISSGLEFSYHFQNFNSDLLEFESDIVGGITETIPSHTERYFDFGLGFSGNYNNHVFGFAIHHITQPDANIIPGNSMQLMRKYTFHYHTIIEEIPGYNNTTAIIPGVIFQKQGNNYHSQLGSYFYYNFLSTGLWLRNSGFFHTNSLIIILGIRTNNFKFDYSYDFSLFNKQLFSYKMSSHEVTLLLQFKYKEKTKRIRAIKCPKI